MKIKILLLLIFLNFTGFSQELSNVSFTQKDNKVLINYDLTGSGLFSVACFYTLDDGLSYIELISITGDAGSNIKAGKGKEIVWDLFNDLTGIKGEIQFKIVAKKTIENSEKYFVITGGIGFKLSDPEKIYEDDKFGPSILLSIKYLQLRQQKVAFGCAIDYTRNKFEVNTAVDPSYQSTNRIIHFSPLIAYNLINNSNFILISTLHSGVTLNQHSWVENTDTPGGSYTTFTALDNLSLGLLLNTDRLMIGLQFTLNGSWDDNLTSEFDYIPDKIYSVWQFHVGLGVGFRF